MLAQREQREAQQGKTHAGTVFKSDVAVVGYWLPDGYMAVHALGQPCLRRAAWPSGRSSWRPRP